VRLTSTDFLPLLVSTDDGRYGDEHLLDALVPGLAVAYSYGPPYGERLVARADLDDLGLNRRALRRAAMENLEETVRTLRFHGQPPALMLSLNGLESSVLLADEVWDDLESTMPGDLVVGVPARDVVIVTSAEAPAGLEKARRAVDRVFFAGDPHLLSQHLLVRRRRSWEVFRPAPSVGRMPETTGPAL